MRHILPFFFILLLPVLSAQSQVNVYTCMGGPVSAIIRSEFSPSDIAYYNAETMSTYGYLGITFLDNASYTYNCHSYAWHLREGNSNKVWINNTTGSSGSCYNQTHNIDRYWTDGCFVQVCNEADADKLHYYCGDHSAVTSTTNAGYYESKWGALAVVRHTRTGVPYSDPVNSVNYYASTRISGNTSLFCSGSRVFSVKNIPGATYTWTFSASLSAIGPTNTNQLSVQPSGSPSESPGWVQIQVSTACSASPSTQKIYLVVGTETSYDIIGMDPSVYLGAGQYLTLSVNAAAVSYDWYIGGGTVIGSSTGQSVYVKLDNCFPGQNAMNDFGANISIDNGCGLGPVYHEHTYAPCGGDTPDPGFMLVLSTSPNPASNDLHATMNISELVQNKQVSKTDRISARLYDITKGSFVKQWMLVNGQNQHTLSLSGVRKGQYILEVTVGKKKANKQVSIQ